MNLGIRAILYTVRKWKKTLLIFCLLLSITTLVLSGLAIVDAQEEQAEEVRGTTGASFTVERDISTGGWTSGYSTQEFMTDDMIKEIAAVDGIAGYDASLITLPRFFNDKGEAFVTVENFSYYCYGSYNSQYHELFLSGRFELVEGKHITDDMSNGVIISKELADRNNLKVGDTVTGIYYPENNTPAVDMEIVGLFDIVADKDDAVNMYDDSSYYDYSNYVFCSMEAAKGLIKGWGEVGSALSRLLAITEAYPDLKANENFKELQAQLEGTENRISVERKRFNDTARAYNTAIRTFPRNLLAGMFGFDKRPYFESEEGADKAPKVEF
mgnify:CR=1 FL=1